MAAEEGTWWREESAIQGTPSGWGSQESCQKRKAQRVSARKYSHLRKSDFEDINICNHSKDLGYFLGIENTNAFCFCFYVFCGIFWQGVYTLRLTRVSHLNYSIPTSKLVLALYSNQEMLIEWNWQWLRLKNKQKKKPLDILKTSSSWQTETPTAVSLSTHIWNLVCWYFQTTTVSKVTEIPKAAMMTPFLMLLSQNRSKGKMASAAFQENSTALK